MSQAMRIKASRAVVIVRVSSVCGAGAISSDPTLGGRMSSQHEYNRRSALCAMTCKPEGHTQNIRGISLARWRIRRILVAATVDDRRLDRNCGSVRSKVRAQRWMRRAVSSPSRRNQAEMKLGPGCRPLASRGSSLDAAYSGEWSSSTLRDSGGRFLFHSWSSDSSWAIFSTPPLLWVVVYS